MNHVSKSSIIPVETSSFTPSPKQKFARLVDNLRNLLTNDFDLVIEDKKIIDEFIKIVDNLKRLKPHLDVIQIGLLVSVQMLANSFKTDIPYVLDSIQKVDCYHENNVRTMLRDQLTYLRRGEKFLRDEISILVEKEASISRDIASINKHNASFEEEVAEKKEERNKIIEVMKKKDIALDNIAAEVSEINIVRLYRDREFDNMGEDFDVAFKMKHDMKEAWNNIKDLLDLM